MLKEKAMKKICRFMGTMVFALCTMFWISMEASAVSFPGINVIFEPSDESVIVEGVPAFSADRTVEYQVEGYLNYEKERIETFCYGPHVMPYDVPEKQAYIFNWGDREFLLPCTGEYKFTAYITAIYRNAQGQMVEEKGPKTTITFTLHKKDESTNWGPGLPNTTIETYDMNQIKGKDKTIKIEEPDYVWTIHGKDIESVPEANFSLKITAEPAEFKNDGVEDFFGETIARKFNIEYDGEFGFKATLDYKVGAEYTGKYANLFYVPGDGSFEFMGGCPVDENGMAQFIFTHASDYVIAITAEEYTGQELNPKQQEEEKESSVAVESEAAAEETVAPEEAESEKEKEEAVKSEEKEGITSSTADSTSSTEALQEQGKQPQEDVTEPIITIGATMEETQPSKINVLPLIACGGVLTVIIIAVVYVKKKKK